MISHSGGLLEQQCLYFPQQKWIEVSPYAGSGNVATPPVCTPVPGTTNGEIMNAHDHIAPSDAPLDQNFAHAAAASAVNCPPPQPKRSSAGASSIPAFKFDTRGVPIDHQYDSWRKSFSSMLEFGERRDRSRGFEGKQTVWDLGSLAFSRIRTSALEFASVPGHTRREALDHWTLTVPLGGIDQHQSVRAGSFQGGAGIVQVHSLGALV